MPALGLITMSTAYLTVGLIDEIEPLEPRKDRERCMDISLHKLAQLKRLSVAISFLYAALLGLLLASLVNLWRAISWAFDGLIALAVLSIATALGLLFVFSHRATWIRQEQLKL